MFVPIFVLFIALLSPAFSLKWEMPQEEFVRLKTSCNNKDVDSCITLYAYSFFNRNYKEAFKYAKKGCEYSRGKFCKELAMFYEKGIYVKKNCKKAINLYKKSCEKRNYASCYNLGLLYENGNCTKKNINKAILLLKESCYNDYIDACVELASFYKNKIDKEKYLYYSQLACQGAFYESLPSSKHYQMCYIVGKYYEDNFDTDKAFSFYIKVMFLRKKED